MKRVRSDLYKNPSSFSVYANDGKMMDNVDDMVSESTCDYRKAGAFWTNHNSSTAWGASVPPPRRERSCVQDKDGNCITCLTAEMIVLLHAFETDCSKLGVYEVGGTLYLSRPPLMSSVAVIIAIGIKRVVCYDNPPDRLDSLDRLEEAGIEIILVEREEGA